ncbi:site-specific integrase, partial [Candidatus Bathyarchaeota archaeon]|nr:site-specific integrase [Candidatus Bathyarchaeota archaeon]
MVARWEAGLRVSGWSSDYQAVNNLFRYLKNRKTGSEASRAIYGFTLYAFCLHTKKLPDELVSMKKAEIEKLVEDFCYRKKERGCSARTVNTNLFMLKSFFKVNGFKGNEKLEVESYYQPSRARTRAEYIPTLEEATRMANVAGSLRDRAMILFMMSTGLRNSTIRAVLYGEVKEELDKGTENILIRVHAGMKGVVSSACEGNIEYSIFTSREATEAIRLYIGERRRRRGEIQDKELLFCSEHNRLPLRQRGSKPLTSRELQIIVKETARKAGIKEWMNVVPHCLRKTFESVLRSRLTDGGRLDVKTQEYFMGH